MSDVFDKIDAIGTDGVPVPRASWRGTLAINVPVLGLSSMDYHLKGAKAHTDQKPVKVVKVDSETNQLVVIKSFATATTTPISPSEPIPANPIIPVYVPATKHAFLAKEFEEGIMTEIPMERVVEKQESENGELISPFDRTTRIEVEPDGFVPMERIPEYKFKEIYTLIGDDDKKVREDASRVLKLARYLLEKQTALVAFFSWGRGYQFYTAVLYPYERKVDGRFFFMLGLAEGKLELSAFWSMEEKARIPIADVPQVPLSKPKGSKPKVTISK